MFSFLLHYSLPSFRKLINDQGYLALVLHYRRDFISALLHLYPDIGLIRDGFQSCMLAYILHVFCIHTNPTHSNVPISSRVITFHPRLFLLLLFIFVFICFQGTTGERQETGETSSTKLPSASPSLHLSLIIGILSPSARSPSLRYFIPHCIYSQYPFFYYNNNIFYMLLFLYLLASFFFFFLSLLV